MTKPAAVAADDRRPAPSGGLPPMRAAQSLDPSLRSAAREGGMGNRPLAGGADPGPQIVGPLAAEGASNGAPAYRYVLRHRGRAAGNVRVSLTQPQAISIHDLEVAEPLRGHGFGAALVDAALRLGARTGRTRARLDAGDDGSGRLVRWYRGLGFEHAGVGARGHPAMEADIGRALAIMRRRPGAGSKR